MMYRKKIRGLRFTMDAEDGLAIYEGYDAVFLNPREIGVLEKFIASSEKKMLTKILKRRGRPAQMRA